MIPEAWYHGPLAYFWQVSIHAAVAAAVTASWWRWSGIRAGTRARRLSLATVIVLPLLTAAVPGRTSFDFRERLAWLDTTRFLALPLAEGVRMHHIVLGVGALAAILTAVQELWPVLASRRHPIGAVPPEELVQAARSLPGWHRCEIVVTDDGEEHGEVRVATGGTPAAPRLLVSRGALASLADDELLAAVRHEHAHWHGGRWLASHGLYLVRLLQFYSPAALWAFRELALEVEFLCDAEAVAPDRPEPLARVLLAVYESTDRRDVATRSALRRRVDALLHRGPPALEPPPAALLAVTAVLALGLPWVV